MTDHEYASYFEEDLLPDMTEARLSEEPWKITDDRTADWAVRRIKEEREEYQRALRIAEDRIGDINDKLKAASDRCERKTSFLIGKLSEYFQTVPQKETKTQTKYRLLSGELVFTKPKQTLEPDEEKLLAFLKASAPEYVKVIEKPAWGEYKKRLMAIGGEAVDTETGETVEAVKVVEKPGTFDVK